MPDATPPPVALRAERERTIQSLIDHFSVDDLEVAEFESRLDAAHRATTLAALKVLTADLPAPASAPAPASGARRPAGTTAQRARQTLLAVMSGVMRRGRWTPARNTTTIAVMGGAELDFRDALLGPGETVVRAIAVMGGVSITVPPELEVVVDGFGFMGGFDHRGNVPANPAPDAPRLRVTGVAVMGGVDVRVRAPGEMTEWHTDLQTELRQQRHAMRHQMRSLRRDMRRNVRRRLRGPYDDGRGGA